MAPHDLASVLLLFFSLSLKLLDGVQVLGSNDFVTVQSGSMREIGLIDFNWQDSRRRRGQRRMGQVFIRYESLRAATYQSGSGLTSATAKTERQKSSKAIEAQT